MKKILILFLIIITIICISCGSGPDAVEEPAPAPSQPAAPAPSQPSVTPPSQPSTPVTPPALPPNVSQARDKAVEARTRAMDFDTHTYRPSEWDEIETQFNSANTAADFEAASAAYDELFNRTHQLYAKAREDEILSVRDDLIATGLTPLIQEEFRAADRKVLDALDQYESGEYYAAKENAAKALNEYEAMLLGMETYKVREQLINTGLTQYFLENLYNADELYANAIDQYQAGDISGAKETAVAAKEEYDTLLFGTDVYLVRQDVIDLGFDKYSQDDFKKADESFLAAVDDYFSGNREDAVSGAEEAMLRYRLVLSDGWVYYVNDKKLAASSERQHAIDERANIASREYFREAEALLEEAERLYNAGEAMEAALVFTNAEAMYAISIEDTVNRRRRAEEMIRQAERIVENSNESALQAESIIEGGSR